MSEEWTLNFISAIGDTLYETFTSDTIPNIGFKVWITGIDHAVEVTSVILYYGQRDATIYIKD